VPPPQIPSLLWYAAIVAEPMLLIRLATMGLVRQYPFFSAYLAVVSAKSAMLTIGNPDPHSAVYRTTWLISEPALIVFQALFVYEIYKRIEEHYPNIGVIGRRVLILVVTISAFVCALTLAPDLRALATQSTSVTFSVLVRVMFIVKRCESFIFCGLLTLTLVFYRFWYTPKRRNATVHTAISALYFAVTSVTYIALNLHLPYWKASVANLTGITLCYVAWACLLTRSGEGFELETPMSDEQSTHAKTYFAHVVALSRSLNRKRS
jgi:hypothetical protein